MPTPNPYLTGATQPGSGAYGAVPQIPNPIATAGQATTGNIGNLAGLYGLAGPVNQFNTLQAAKGLATNLPGYQSMIGQSSGNILSHLEGVIPSDVLEQIKQTAAERGISTGLGGSANANTALLRALGLTSMGLQSQGEQELSGAIQRTPTAQLFNPASFFVTPQQQQEAQTAAATMAGAPNPAQAAAAAQAAVQSGFKTGYGNVPAPALPSYNWKSNTASSDPFPQGGEVAGGPLGFVNPAAPAAPTLPSWWNQTQTSTGTNPTPLNLWGATGLDTAIGTATGAGNQFQNFQNASGDLGAGLGASIAGQGVGAGGDQSAQDMNYLLGFTDQYSE